MHCIHHNFDKVLLPVIIIQHNITKQKLIFSLLGTAKKNNNNMQSNNNTTTDSNVSQQNQKIILLALPEGLKIALYCVYCFIFLLGTIGNMLVIYIIGIKHRVERSCDVHIVSLAVADLLTAIVIPVVMIHDMKTNYIEWHLLGTFGCKLFVSMMHMTSIVSSLMLVTISLTRIRFLYS